MSVTPSSPVVGIFTDQAMAEQAVGALYNAGFAHEQIRYSVPGTSGGFFDDLKSLFTGTSAEGANLANDLTSMGLADEEARYYANAYSNGNIILAVQAPGREQEALSVLQQYGAYNTKGAINQATNDVQQSASSTQSESYATPQVSEHDTAYQTAYPVTSAYDTGTYHTSENQVSLDEKTEKRIPQASIVTPDSNADYQADTDAPEHEADYQASQVNAVAPDDTTEDQTTPSAVLAAEHEADYQAPEADTSEHEAGYQAPQAHLEAPAYAPENQTAPANVATPEYEADYHASQANTVTPDGTAEDQTVQADGLASEHDADYPASQADTLAADDTTEDQTTQPDGLAPEHAADYQAPQADMVVVEQESASQQPLPVEIANDAEPQAASSDVVAPEREDDYWSAPSDVSASEVDTAYQPSQASVVTPDDATEEQTAQADVTAPEHGVDASTNMDTSQQEAEMPVSQSSAVSTTPVDELAQLREQLQSIQQQLQDAKLQLQAEKEHETQLQATRELESARQQLQEMQDELQATMAELQETRARLTQYQ